MVSWPGSLPQYLDLGLTEIRQQGFIRSDNSMGPSKQRKRFTATSKYLEGSTYLTISQKSVFDTFYSDTINEGNDEFDFIDPNDFSIITARFTEPPKALSIYGGDTGVSLWQIDLKLEVLP